jgi:CBS domain-containing protein
VEDRPSTVTTGSSVGGHHVGRLVHWRSWRQTPPWRLTPLDVRDGRLRVRDSVAASMPTARDITTTDVETVAPDDDVAGVLTRLARADFDGYPVVENDRVVGIVTQGDLVDLFQPSDRTLWIPVGFPPFLESLTYAVDLSWDELDVGLDVLRNSGKPIREVMTTDVVTVGPDADLDTVLALRADPDRDINRLPVVDEREAPGGPEGPTGAGTEPGGGDHLLGIIARQDVLGTLREEREARAV